MEVFESANKLLAVLSRHCMVAKGEFLWRLAMVTEKHYFFRFSYDDILGTGEPPFPASVEPAPLDVRFSGGGFCALSGAGVVHFKGPLDALILTLFGAPRACRFFRSVGFKRAERGILINTSPLRDGDFVVWREAVECVLVRLQVLVEVDKEPHGSGLFLGFPYVPRDAARREFIWGGGFLAGRLADVFGRALCLAHPRDPGVVCFSADLCEFLYM
jgi:hypothetical protein